MRKNSPRKWLHACLDLLPVILIPVFMIYSHRHTIDSGTIDVPQNEIVDFNQIYNSQNYNADYVITTFDNDIERSVSEGSNTEYRYFNSAPRIEIYDTHIYALRVYIYENNGDLPDTFALLNSNVGITINGLGLSSGIATSTTTINSSVGFVFSDLFSCDFTYSANIFDLTKMFGEGNEPTIQRFNEWYTDVYYEYTLSHKELLKNTSTITFSDTDIMSQFTYQLYNSVDKYFNMGNVFNMTSVYDWFNLNIFGGNAPISIYIVWNIVLYEFVMDLLFLLYGLFMWFIDMVQHLMDKPFKSIK